MADRTNIRLTPNEKKVLRAWRNGAKNNDDVRKDTKLHQDAINIATGRIISIFGAGTMKERAERADAEGML